MIDRETEQRELAALATRPRPALALVYGRRRVGKTYLLDHVWSESERFYFLFGDSTSDQNRIELLREFGRWRGEEVIAADYPSWRTVFRLLLTAGPRVVVLDEFQYLLEAEQGVASQLTAIWDRELADREVLCVLSGSEVSTMQRLTESDSPLYGRITYSKRLRSFDYYDTAAMVGHWTRRDQIYAYGIFGGLPRYLAAIEPEESLEAATIRTLLSRTGEVHLQLEHLLAQERGIRDPASYRAVLAAVARGATETNEITQAAGLQDNKLKARRALQTLEDLGLIGRELNFDANPKTGYRNRIADHAVSFWYRFVESNRSRIELGNARAVWHDDVEPHLDTYTGKIFEAVAREALHRFHEVWGLAMPVDIGRWEGLDKGRRSIEIDIVSRLSDGAIATGEVKWSSNPVGPSVHHALLRNLDDLSRSGQGWAGDAQQDSAAFIYLSAGGFSPEFVTLAQDDARIRLIDLESMLPRAR